MTTPLDTPPHTLVDMVMYHPRIYYLKHFLTDAECMELRETSEPKLRRSTTVDPETGTDIIVDSRSSNTCFYYLSETPLVGRLEERIAALIQHPITHAEGLQIIHYKAGQEYQPHYDFFDPNLKGTPVALAKGGQRLATLIMYLATVEEGGDTIFPELNLQFRAIQGDALLFYNLLENGEVDRRTLHGSTPVTKGEKWAATKWMREYEY